MKKITLMLICVVAMLSMTSCSFETVDENQVAVLVKRPILFGSDGTEVLMPGRHTVAASSDLIYMLRTPVKYKESFVNLTTKDKSDVDFDFYFNISIMAQQSNMLYGDYTLDWYKTNLQPTFRNIIRDKCKEYDMIPITSDSKVAKDFETYVITECRKVIAKLKLPVILNDGSMGKASPPPEVLKERSATAASKQRQNTLTQEFKNLSQKELNEKKRATADKAYKLEMKLSNDQFIKLKELETQAIAYKKAGTVIVDGSATMNPTYSTR